MFTISASFLYIGDFSYYIFYGLLRVVAGFKRGIKEAKEAVVGFIGGGGTMTG